MFFEVVEKCSIYIVTSVIFWSRPSPAKEKKQLSQHFAHLAVNEESIYNLQTRCGVPAGDVSQCAVAEGLSFYKWLCQFLRVNSALNDLEYVLHSCGTWSIWFADFPTETSILVVPHCDCNPDRSGKYSNCCWLISYPYPFHSYGHLPVTTGYKWDCHSIIGVLLVLITNKWPYPFQSWSSQMSTVDIPNCQLSDLAVGRTTKLSPRKRPGRLGCAAGAVERRYGPRTM